VYSGTTPDTKIEGNFNGNINWYTPAEITENRINYVFESERKITEEARLKKSIPLLPKNTVLLTSRAPIGKVALAGSECCTNQGFKNIVCDESIVIPKYLYYWLSSKRGYLNSLGRGATFKEISKKIVEDIEIPILPLNIQERLVENLDKVNTVILKRQTQIEALDELIQSIFLEMFGDSFTNNKKFPTQLLSEIASVGSSKRVFVKELVNEGIPFYRGTEIGSLATGEVISPTIFVTEEHYDSLKKSSGVPKVGDLLLPSICPDGRIWRVQDETPFYFKDGRVLWIHFTTNDINPLFIQYALKEKLIRDYLNIASGTTFAELKIFSLKNVKLMIPPLDLQNKFATIVSEIENQRIKMELSLQEMKNNYDSLLQKAFKGELF